MQELNVRTVWSITVETLVFMKIDIFKFIERDKMANSHCKILELA